MKGYLTHGPNFKCKMCSQEKEIILVPQLKHIDIGNEKLRVVKPFCYLGDVNSESGGCYNATASCIRSAWKKFHKLIPFVCNKSFSLV